MLYVINEVKMNDLYMRYRSVSKITDKFIRDRMDKGKFGSISLDRIEYNEKKDILVLRFHVEPTNSNVVNVFDYNSNTIKVDNKYTVLVVLLDVKKVLKDNYTLVTKYMREKNGENIVIMLMDKCEVKLHSNDMSFLYQGVWYNLSKKDSSYYDFKFKDTGVWKKRHNKDLYITKHIYEVIYYLYDKKEFNNKIYKYLLGNGVLDDFK